VRNLHIELGLFETNMFPWPAAGPRYSTEQASSRCRRTLSPNAAGRRVNTC